MRTRLTPLRTNSLPQVEWSGATQVTHPDAGSKEGARGETMKRAGPAGPALLSSRQGPPRLRAGHTPWMPLDARCRNDLCRAGRRVVREQQQERRVGTRLRRSRPHRDRATGIAPEAAAHQRPHLQRRLDDVQPSAIRAGCRVDLTRGIAHGNGRNLERTEVVNDRARLDSVSNLRLRVG